VVIHGIGSLVEELLHGNIGGVENSPVAVSNGHHLFETVSVNNSKCEIILPFEVGDEMDWIELRVFLIK
jgi:hypothetical protein